ncbi:hypothetical protein ACFPRL_36010 [Pseudoclavibacter helvolus]
MGRVCEPRPCAVRDSTGDIGSYARAVWLFTPGPIVSACVNVFS